MKKYKLECYGWEMEALCHSLDNDKAERINKLVEEGQELYEEFMTSKIAILIFIRQMFFKYQEGLITML